jgi:molybdenum cofactor cytidylyltransferase
MRLMEALRIQPGYVVAFVGAGGKSMAIRRLATERPPDSPLILTTTTKIRLDQKDLARQHFVLDSEADLPRAFAHLDPESPILLTGKRDEVEAKWLGLIPEIMEALVVRTRELGAILLVEADGARGSSLKAPADHEPVLPSSCDLVVPVVGLDAIGEDVVSSKIHRPQRLMELLEFEGGDRIKREHIARILSSTQGALKDIPLASEVRVLLNKAETEEALEHGRQIAFEAMKCERVTSVILAAVAKEAPVAEVFSRVAGVVLAAGSSSRINGLKQLIQFRDKPLVTYAVEAAINGGLEPIVVVVGGNGSAIRETIQGLGVNIVDNLASLRGQGSSVKVGLDAIGEKTEAVVFLLADMPLVSSELIRALVGRHRKTLSSVVVPYAQGKRGNPVLFDRVTFNALRTIEDERGGRAIFEVYPPEQLAWDDTVLFDVDTEDDYDRLRDFE